MTKQVDADRYMNYAKGGKVEKVMHEYKEGALHSGSATGPKVTSREQAVAIAMSEAQKKKKGYQGGGEVMGPGGPTDDVVPANLSNGEYVIPADVVHLLGTAFFDKIVQQAQMKLGAAAPNPFTDMAANEMGEMTPGTGM